MPYEKTINEDRKRERGTSGLHVETGGNRAGRPKDSPDDEVKTERDKDRRNECQTFRSDYYCLWYDSRMVIVQTKKLLTIFFVGTKSTRS